MKTPALPFTNKPKRNSITITLIREKDFKTWSKSGDKNREALVKQTGFGTTGSKTLILEDGIFAIINDKPKIYDIAPTVEAMGSYFSADFLKNCSFFLKGKGDLTTICIGLGYRLLPI